MAARQPPRRTGEKQAIFYQKSKALQNEFMLIQLVTVRESVRGKLEKLVTAVKTLSRPLDEACMIEMFGLIHNVREATCDLLNAVATWQQGFTHNIRPQMLNIDYLVDMTNSMEFFSSCNLRKEWRFQLGTGNFMLLPLPTVGRTQKPRAVSKEMREALKQFANPTEHRLVTCYTQLLNCMEPEVFKKMMPIHQWMKNRWVPNIEKEPRGLKMDPWSRMMRGEIDGSEYKALLLREQLAAAEAQHASAAASGFAEARRKALTPTSAEVASEAAADANPMEAVAALRLESPERPKTASNKDPFAFIPAPSTRTSPLRPDRPTRADIFRQHSQQRQQQLQQQHDPFSDDSEDEARKRKVREKKKELYKPPARDDDGDDSPKRGLREAKLEPPKTIEEKAARSLVNTRLLRETWNAPPDDAVFGPGHPQSM